jgi:hypothetical protein
LALCHQENNHALVGHEIGQHEAFIDAPVTELSEQSILTTDADGFTLGGAENFFESHNEQLERSNQGLKPISLVHVLEKLKNCCLFENPLFTRISGVS